MSPAGNAGSPTVSVIIPAYNVAPYVASAVESAFAQTYRDFEVIVIDDGSTDGTEVTLAPYRDRLVYVKQENLGNSGARNTGLGHARGRYIALLDGDDLWMPTYLERLVGMLEATPDASGAFPNAVLFGATPSAGKLYHDIYPCSEPVTFERILRRECQIFGSLVLRSAAVREVGGYDPKLRYAEDFDLWLRLAQRGHRFLYTSEPLVRYRRREGCLCAADIRVKTRNLLRVFHKIQACPVATAAHRGVAAEEKEKLLAQFNLAVGKELVLEREFRAAAKRIRLAASTLRTLKLLMLAVGLRIAPQCIYQLYRRSLASRST